MARLDEIAEGIATLLKMSSVPEPLGIDLWNQTPNAATFFVRAVIDACERHVSPLSGVRICAELGKDLDRNLTGSPKCYERIPVETSLKLESRVEFYRFPWTK